MKIVCERERFLSAFQTAAAVVPSRSPKPILQNVKLEVSSQGTTLTATDLEVGIRVEAAGIEVEAPGSAILPVGTFGSILRENSDDKLRVEADQQGIVVRGERSEFRLAAQNPDEFPAVTSFNEQRYFELPARLVKELIRRTLFATDTESSRYALGGILLEFTADQVTAVATDGRRLAKMEGPCQAVGGFQTPESMTIVPTRAMQLVERALQDGDAEVQLAARANDILIRGPRSTIYARLVEGRFPKWRDVFPQRREAAQINLTVGPLYSAVRQAAIASSGESRGILFSFGDGSLVLSGQASEVGQSRVELPISYDGSPISIVLDHRFVSEFLKVLDPEKTFVLEVKDSEGAALLTTDDGYGYVVMPLSRDR